MGITPKGDGLGVENGVLGGGPATTENAPTRGGSAFPDHTFTVDELVADPVLKGQGLTQDLATRMVDALLKRGEIYEPKGSGDGRYKFV